MAKSPIWARAIRKSIPPSASPGATSKASAAGATRIGTSWEAPRNTAVDTHVVKNNPPVMLRLRTNLMKTSMPKNKDKHTAEIATMILTVLGSLPASSQNINIARHIKRMNNQKNNLVENLAFGFPASNFSMASV